jgi:hypothetical protein
MFVSFCGLVCDFFGVVLVYLLSSYVYGGCWESEEDFFNSSLLFFFSFGAQVHLSGMW